MKCGVINVDVHLVGEGRERERERKQKGHVITSAMLAYSIIS